MGRDIDVFVAYRWNISKNGAVSDSTGGGIIAVELIGVSVKVARRSDRQAEATLPNPNPT